MQINNNVNSMLQLEKKLEQSASELSRLSYDHRQPEQKNQKNIQQNMESQNSNTPEVDSTQELVKQIEIPIAYTANAEVISTQNATHKTLVDIKA